MVADGNEGSFRKSAAGSGTIAKLAAAELSNPYLHASSKYRGWILISSNFKAEG